MRKLAAVGEFSFIQGAQSLLEFENEFGPKCLQASFKEWGEIFQAVSAFKTLKRKNLNYTTIFGSNKISKKYSLYIF